MATHADNKIYGNLIKDSVINVGSINNVDGVNPGAIINFLPVEHDITHQVLAGQTNEFELNPPVAPGTERFFELFLDGQRLIRSETPENPDYYLYPNRNKITFLPNFTLDQNSQLIAVYVEEQII